MDLNLKLKSPVSLLILCLSGCVIIPTKEHGAKRGERSVIAEEDRSFQLNGSTTREDVLLSLGMPDATFNDERFITYNWTAVVGYWFGGGGYGGVSGGEFTRDNILLLEFDDEGRLQRFDRIKGYYGKADTKLEDLLESRLKGESNRL